MFRISKLGSILLFIKQSGGFSFKRILSLRPSRELNFKLHFDISSDILHE
jgi:hypothetical protein